MNCDVNGTHTRQLNTQIVQLFWIVYDLEWRYARTIA